jgi:archaellum biogenesis ATPase FlaH
MKLQQSLALLSKGRSILPVGSNKLPDTKYIKEWKTFMMRRPSEAEVKAWFETEPERNIGIVTGKISGITVVDLDLGSVDYKTFPKTFCVRTGSGGYHLYYKYADVPSQGLKDQHIDIKNDGGYILAPFCKTVDSTNKKGGSYDIIYDGDLADFPRDKFQSITKPDINWTELLAGVKEGGRNDSAKKVIGKLLNAFKNPADWETTVWPLFKQWNQTNTPPLDENTIRTLYKNIAIRQAQQNRELNIKFEEEKLTTDIIKLADSAIEHAKTLSNEITATGIPCLDDILEGGFRLEHVAVISGYTGQGKSLFAMHITADAIKKNIPVLWFQFELPPTEFWNKYKVLGITADMPLYVPQVYKTATMDWVEEIIINAVAVGVKIVVFDLLDFLQENSKKRDDKNGEDSAILVRLKKMASQYKIMILLMAHSRKPAQHVYTPPTAYDIRGTGNIVGISNWAVIIHRVPKKKVHDEFAEEEYTPYFLFKVVKNRINGRIYTFYGEYVNNVLKLVTPQMVKDATRSYSNSSLPAKTTQKEDDSY